MSDSVFATIVAAAITMCFGLVLAFVGYRFFLVLLPIFGFFFGLAFGAHSIQALFGDGFFATTASWVAGFFVGLLFAVLSYLFWVFAVAIAAGSLGYTIATGLLTWIGLDLGVFVWLVGVALGVAFAFVAIVMNLQKLVVIVATAMVGAGAILGTFVALFSSEKAPQIVEQPLKSAADVGPLYLLLYLFVAALGIGVQLATSRTYQIERYNRWEATTSSPTSSLRPRPPT
jgi:hypothetical protein